MEKAGGKCSHCLCRLIVFSRQLVWWKLSKICPVCGYENTDWTEPKTAEEKDYEIIDSIDKVLDKEDRQVAVVLERRG